MRPRATNMVWSVVAAVMLLTAGAVAALLSGREGASFMFDLEQTEPALARVEPVLDPPPAPPLSRRVVLAVVDGLRLDASRRMPFLNRLRAAGVDAVAASPYPTYSKPNYVTILTGVPPEASGVRTNRYPGVVELDSLMDRVRAAAWHAAYASDYEAMPRLFLRPRRAARTGPVPDVDLMEDEEGRTVEDIEAALMADLRGDFDDARYAPWPGGLRDAAEQTLQHDNALVVLLIGLVDAAGHEYGGDSEEYAAAAAIADQILEEVLAAVDLSRDTVVIVADHGHTDRGGHGGLEPEAVQVPLILAGAGVRAGAPVDGALLQDVAPTVARLLGLPPPGHGLGRTLVEALAADDATRARIAAQDQARAARNDQVVTSAIHRARADRLEKRALRLGVLVVSAVVLLVAAWWLRWLGGVRLDWKSLVVGVPAFFGVYYILIAVLGQRFSPSLMPARGHIASELIQYGVVATVVQIGAGWWALRRKLHLPDRLAAANGIALVGLAVAMTPVALLWTLFPAPYVEVPGPRALVLIPAVQISVACYAVGVALTLFVEVVVFFARAVDPRVRLMRLERALEKARLAAERSGETPLVPRKKERRARAAAHRAAAEVEEKSS
jgi:hypothetical protein